MTLRPMLQAESLRSSFPVHESGPPWVGFGRHAGDSCLPPSPMSPGCVRTWRLHELVNPLEVSDRSRPPS